MRVERRSLYLTMRDGARIAIDLHLPRGASGKRPAIVRQTRYFRGVVLREPFARLPIEWLLDHAADTRQRFLAAGYAWIDVCARGSGASFGHRPCPWSPDETADGAEVVSWIVAQPWSNARVGSTGVSYDGTAADFLLVAGHPAVKAIAPRFSLWDVYSDVAFPGGIHLAWFTAEWARFNRSLDGAALDRAVALQLRNQLRALRSLPRRGLLAALAPLLAAADRDAFEAACTPLLRLVAPGVRPVDDDHDRALLARAVAAHARNLDVHTAALAIECRDDAGVSRDYPDASIDFFSPHAYADRIAESGAAVYGSSGWLDAGYPAAAIKRFRAVRTPGSKLLLGPWEHGGMQNISPYSPGRKAAFDHDGELLRFFDRHLRDGDDAGPPVRYFTMGEEAWKSADDWPPPGARTERWHLGDARALTATAPDRAGHDEHRVDPSFGTGWRSRWNALLGVLPPVGYPDQVEWERSLCVYRSPPLGRALEVTGHPLVRLYLAASAHDADVFAYLQDERPDGRVDYVTEGQLRALHRRSNGRVGPYPTVGPWRSFERADAEPLVPGEVAELVFELLPISWRFGRGHRLRLAIGGADCDHFRVAAAATFAIHRGPARPSRLELPVMDRQR